MLIDYDQPQDDTDAPVPMDAAPAADNATRQTSEPVQAPASVRAWLDDSAIEHFKTKNKDSFLSQSECERLLWNLEAIRKRFKRVYAEAEQVRKSSLASKELLDSTPQFDTDSELAVLGAIILRPAKLKQVAAVLTDEDFYWDDNRTIYNVLLGLRRADKPIDTLMLTTELRKRGLYDDVGGAVHIAEIITGCPTAENALYYCESIKEKSRQRALRRAAEMLLQKAVQHDSNPAQIVKDMMRTLRTLA